MLKASQTMLHLLQKENVYLVMEHLKSFPQNPAHPGQKAQDTSARVPHGLWCPLTKRPCVRLGSCQRYEHGQEGSQEPTRSEAGGPAKRQAGWFQSPAKLGHLRATAQSAQGLEGTDSSPTLPAPPHHWSWRWSGRQA